MLQELYIKDLVIIESLHLTFKKGFSAFSGETGAGKSILLDALALSLGKRGDASLIRKGSDQTIISAVFEVEKTHPITEILFNLSIIGEEYDVVQLTLRRHLTQKGISKAFINDIPVSVSTLKQVGDALLEIHGQFDHLFDAKMHRSLLDKSILEEDIDRLLDMASSLYQKRKDLVLAIKSLEDEEKQHAQDDFLNTSILADLSLLDLQINEEEFLLKERQSIDELGKAATILERAVQLSSDGSFLKEVRFLISKMTQNELLSPLSIPLTRIESDLLEVEEQARDLFIKTKEAHLRLQEIDERLYLLRSKAKKYGVDTSYLPVLLEKAITHQQKDFQYEKNLLEKQQEAAEKELADLCSIITKHRQKAAALLEKNIQNEFAFLKLPHARFNVKIESGMAYLSSDGWDRVEFLIAANKEQDFTSLSKSASGGELSRIMLALKTILSESTSLSCIVFDEIETGVGGAVATAIGQRMKELSRNLQVLSITHSPQVAAQADANYLVKKSVDNGSTKTIVTLLNHDEKILELARMISGENITESAIKAAQDLI